MGLALAARPSSSAPRYTLPMLVAVMGALLRSPLRHPPCLWHGRGSSWAGWAAVCAPGSVLGSGGLTGTLSLGLAVQHSREQSEEMLNEICNGECAQCCVCWAGGALLSSGFQLVSQSHVLLLAWKNNEEGWHSPEGMPLGLCRCVGFISALFPSVAALQPLEDDAHPAVRSLAAGTIQMLRHERQQAASARSRLAALCCWPCIAI